MTNPARTCSFNKRFSRLFLLTNKPDLSSWFFHINSDLSEVGFLQKTVLHYSVPPGPPWLYTIPSVDFSVHAYSKSDRSPEFYSMSIAYYAEHCTSYSIFVRLSVCQFVCPSHADTVSKELQL